MSSESRGASESLTLFDEFDETYEEACGRGLALAGESRDYFAAARLEFTAGWLRSLQCDSPQRIVDFGCGAGHSTPHLRQLFPEADILGLDVSRKAIARAQNLYVGHKVSFEVLSDYHPSQDQDLVYCNGVFHHIKPDERSYWTRRVYGMLAPGGWFSLWENNPWNPGTRMVMKRIPFDRDAVPISSTKSRRLLLQSQFELIGTRYRFYFPHRLRQLRFLERYGARLPLGAQYCVLARKPRAGGLAKLGVCVL
jgi:SAM-dependent methyltransferase